ncbi:MAG: DUF4124 domain-containing protein [Pseudomonadota bacterium]
MRPLLPFILALLVAASAHAELRRCVDDTGHITITDSPCATPQALDDSASDDYNTVRAAPNPAPTALPARTAARRLPPYGTIVPSPRFAAPVNAKSFHVDTSTLRAAHEAALLADSMRQQTRLASR